MHKLYITTTLILLAFISFPLVYADRGIIPVTPGVSVYEPGQKAIIAWNGQQEILILTTDVSSNRQTTVLEILPLPSKPTVEAGSFQSFQKIQEMIWGEGINRFLFGGEGDARQGSVEILFHTQIGAHNITVVQATEAYDLLEFANSFLTSSGTNQTITLQKYQTVIEDYISRGFKDYALDIITFTPEEKSINPILYKFDSPTLYYPLLITTPVGGNGQITIFTLTKEKLETEPWPLRIATYQITSTELWQYWRPIQFPLSKGDLATIDLRISELFTDIAWLTALKYEGSLDLLTRDLMISHLGFSYGTNSISNTIIAPVNTLILFFLLGTASTLVGTSIALLIHRKRNKEQQPPTASAKHGSN